MSLLLLSPSACVRALSVNSICTLCADVCPVNAISITDRLPSINQVLCVGCAGCVSVCPTEALRLDDFSSTDFFFTFASDEDNMISCQKNVPCIAALSHEQLISFAQMKHGVVLDTGHCGQCDIGVSILATLANTLENANYLLEAIESEFRVECSDIGYNALDESEAAVERRDFFKTFHLRGLGKIREDFEKEIQKTTDEFIEYSTDSSHTKELRAKKITDRRKLFFTAIKRLPPPSIFHVVDSSKIPFTSQKLMDEAACTACEMCYRICPTGALTSDMRNSKIDFDPFLCVKCHLCHDVCEPKAITLSPSYNLVEWYTPKVQNLVTYRVRRCDECDALFSSSTGEKICRRCRLEDEEAKELWGIQ
ncbi:MAG: 4Fe-4S binding protein [Sulfuricurvum sp.]|nr:4Fe-4S binding protein [Sulfuricurvum sp.]MDD5386404.1 4Fe-4S binding protein [Sulfuricurvum sp.]